MNATVAEGCRDIVGGLKHAGMFLYFIDPYETMFENYEDVPDYIAQVWFPFFILIALENVILYTKKGSSLRINDQVTSLSHWILQETGRVFFRGAEYYLYILIHEHFRLAELTWNSVYTWYITAIAVDFCYYWVHRANHEVLFLWAHHQVHHSSEEFNLVVGLRQSILQQWCSFMFYLPLALFIPPSHFVAHHQFNLMYQMWIHTTVIDNLGPLEWIFNTPRHHRVHHGCNLYCLDKNYGGVLIIWDRLFGTFMDERPKEKIIYGLVVSPQTYNPIYLQIFYTISMIKRSLLMRNLRDAIAVYWKGPSWMPGLPRLGLDEFKVNVTSRIKYNPRIPSWHNFYILLHFGLVIYTHIQINYGSTGSFSYSSILSSLNNICALVTISQFFETSKYSSILELLRCSLFLTFLMSNQIIYSPSTRSLMIFTYIISCSIWIYDICGNFLKLTNSEKIDQLHKNNGNF